MDLDNYNMNLETYIRVTLKMERKMEKENSIIKHQVVSQTNLEDHYKGQFKKDYRTGYGVMRYANGDIYEGEWFED